jgi:hypothetical protein
MTLGKVVGIGVLVCATMVQTLAGDSDPLAPRGLVLDQMRGIPQMSLRGFGRIETQGWVWRDSAGKKLTQVVFRCQTSKHAAITASKYLEDLLAYGAVSLAGATKDVAATLLTVRHGGTWLLAQDGNCVRVVSGPDLAFVKAALNAWDTRAWTPVTRNAYPRYLDNFDNAGLGIWWMPSAKTDEQLTWMKDFPAVANLHAQTLSQTPAPHVYDVSSADGAIAQLRSIDKSFRYMIWAVGAGTIPWINIHTMPGQSVEEAAEGFTGRDLFRAIYKQHQVVSSDVHTVMLDTLVQMMRQRVNEPDLLAWMEPHGEFHKSDPMSRPPEYKTRFPSYLQMVKRYDLATLGQAYAGNDAAFASWADIPIPDTATFRGRYGDFLDLDDVKWAWKPAKQEEGKTGNWTDPKFDDTAWARDFRISKHMLANWNDRTRVAPLWMRFTHDVPQQLIDKAKDRPLYLHLMPYTEHKGRPLSVWINGKLAGKDLVQSKHYINRHVAIDAREFLHAGQNSFAIFNTGGRIAYRVFLSFENPGDYPYEDVRRNRQYLDWNDYLIWEKLQTLERYLKAMRSVDPVRPIKVMTPHMFQSKALELCARYGAYPQLTGEGGWYRPMHYKGYSRLRGLPGSSEPGGAKKTAVASQEMFGLIFWESQDCHDYVFDLTRELWSHKEALAWWSANKPLLRTLGKTDYIAPKIGVLRDTRQSERYGNGEIWSWDVSRGVLPALGMTPVLIDGPDFENGLADHVPVIMDCATIVMSPEMVDAIERYVARGGVFIAQHHTGQHSTEQRNAWPLARRFGLKITPKLLSDANYHKWPLGKIHFTDTQDIWPSLRGKAGEGSGVSIDWANNERTGAVAITSDDKRAASVATWEDGTMAVTDVHHGAGRFILAGTPFFYRLRDEQGKFLNESRRQALVEEMLASLQVERDTHVGDERVWFEKRASKNGLYDVYVACAMGIRQKNWKVDDRFPCDLTFDRKGPVSVVEPTAANCDDIPAQFANGQVSLGTVALNPYKPRQFAVLRKDAGLAGPLHWLQTQWGAWRQLDPTPASDADRIIANARHLVERMGEDGLDISTDWKVRINPENPDDTAWLTADVSTWQDSEVGSWIARGWPQARVVQYRKTIALPPAWLKGKNRICLGADGQPSLGIRDRATLWVNGKQVLRNISGYFTVDVSEIAAAGTLDLAMTVQGKPHDFRTLGPAGKFFLRKLAEPVHIMELNQAWTKLDNWQGGTDTLNMPVKTRLFGLKTTVRLPAKYAGHPVRLRVVDATGGTFGFLINDTGYVMRSETVASAVGERIDKWLKPGLPNTIELYGNNHRKGTPFNANIKSVFLEVYPKITGQ